VRGSRQKKAKKVQALQVRARTLNRRVRLLEEENRALRVAVGLDAARIEEEGTAKRFLHGERTEMPVGRLRFPLPAGWDFDRGEILWETRDGQKYLKVPIIKTEV
jgi:hypothetical protein